MIIPCIIYQRNRQNGEDGVNAMQIFPCIDCPTIIARNINISIIWFENNINNMKNIKEGAKNNQRKGQILDQSKALAATIDGKDVEEWWVQWDW